VDVLHQFEKDLVNGYYRLHSDSYEIPTIVSQLCMLYLFILDEFTLPSSPQINNPDLDNEEIECDDIVISGFNSTTIECKYGGITASVFGRNVISAHTARYHHWRFQILTEGEIDIAEGDDEWNFVVGVTPMALRNNVDCTYSVIGSHGLKRHAVSQSYTNERFAKKGDVLDMYLSFASNAEFGELSYVLNNEALGVAFDRLSMEKEYRMYCSLTHKHSKLELLSYDSSSTHYQHQLEHCNEFEYLCYIRSIPNIDEKLLHLERLMMNEHQIAMPTEEVANDYIDCLVTKKQFERCYEFLCGKEFKVGMASTGNVKKIGCFFYFQQNDFDKALQIFQLITDDQVLIDEHITVEIAFCYEQSGKKHGKQQQQPAAESLSLSLSEKQKFDGDDEKRRKSNNKNKEEAVSEHYLQAIKYYELSLSHESRLGDHGRNECLHHMGAIYFNHLFEYKLALSCFLKLGHAEINRRDLESVIASCYDQLKEYEAALQYFAKYEAKYGEKASVLIAIASIYFKCNNVRKADEYFEKALNLNEASSNWMIQCKYGYYLLNYKHDYVGALRYFDSSSQIASNAHELGESYKCIGATYDKLGNMDKAIEFTDKVLEINETDADALNNAGYFYLSKKQYQRALNYLTRSLHIYPDGELTTGNIAICLYEMQQAEQALPYLHKVVHALPADVKHPDVGPKCLYYYVCAVFAQQQQQHSQRDVDGEPQQQYLQCQRLLQQLVEHPGFEQQFKHSKDEIYYLYARVEAKLMRFPHALKHLQMAYKCNPNRLVYRNQIRILQRNAMLPQM